MAVLPLLLEALFFDLQEFRCLVRPCFVNFPWHNISEFCQVQTRIIDQLMKYPQQLIMRRQLVKSQQQKTLSVIFAMDNLQNKVLLGIEILASQKTKLLIIQAKLPNNLIFI